MDSQGPSLPAEGDEVSLFPLLLKVLIIIYLASLILWRGLLSSPLLQGFGEGEKVLMVQDRKLRDATIKTGELESKCSRVVT